MSASTVRLRARRRLWSAFTRWRVISALIVAAVLFCGGAVTVAGPRRASREGGRGPRTADSPPAMPRSRRRERPGPRLRRGWPGRWPRPRSSPATRRCARCCRAREFRRVRLLVLGAGNAGPLGSDVIVSTAAVREEFGSRLTGVYAPVALATFGSGSAQVAVRVVAADGSAAYRRSLHADVAPGAPPVRCCCATRMCACRWPAANWPPGRSMRGCSALSGRWPRCTTSTSQASVRPRLARTLACRRVGPTCRRSRQVAGATQRGSTP